MVTPERVRLPRVEVVRKGYRPAALATLQKHDRSLSHQPASRWVRLDFQADLPANQPAFIDLTIDEYGAGTETAHENLLVVDDDETGLSVATGPLRFHVPRSGAFLVDRITLDKASLFTGGGVEGNVWKTSRVESSFARRNRGC